MNAAPSSQKFFAVVPAAGVGRRMGGEMPKQYLSLCGRSIVEQTLNKLLCVSNLEKIIVAVSAADDHWTSLAVASHPRIVKVIGGRERSDSVLNGLVHLSTFANESDWVLVHDVARPCVAVNDIQRMMQHLSDHKVGGILAIPVNDTLKRVNGVAIEATVDRLQLWQAQTPQMFRLGMLRDALSRAVCDGVTVTDEASAIERAGYYPVVVEGSNSNIKITRPEDLPLADYYFSRQQLHDKFQDQINDE